MLHLALVKVCPDKELKDKWIMDQDVMENLKVRLGFETGVQVSSVPTPYRVKREWAARWVDN